MDKQMQEAFRTALELAGIDPGPQVAAAEQLAAAARVSAATVRGATAPDLETATAATVAKLIEQRAQHAALHPHRATAAERAVAIADQRVDAAWTTAAYQARAAIAAAFNDAAAELPDALDALPNGEFRAEHHSIYAATSPEQLANLADVTGRLDAYAACRHWYARQTPQLDRDRVPVGGDKLEAITRLLHVESLNGFTQSTALPANGSGLAHWAAAAADPRYTIQWQELPAQIANAEALAPKPTRHKHARANLAG